MKKECFDNIVGHPDIVKELKTVSEIIKKGKLFEDLGLHYSYNLMIVGGKDSEKRLLAKALINDTPLKYIQVDHSNSSLAEICNAVLPKALNMSPCILLFEDINEYENADDYSFFKNFIDLVDNQGIYIIATENKANPNLDAQFDKIISIKESNYYDYSVRANEVFMKYKLEPSFDVKTMARLVKEYNTSGINQIMKQAAITAGLAGQKFITEKDVYYSFFGLNDELISNFIRNIGRSGITMAAYCAGISIVTDYLQPDSVLAISIIDESVPPKYDYWVQADCDLDGMNAFTMKKHLFVLLSGKAACEVLLNEPYMSKWDTLDYKTAIDSLLDQYDLGRETLFQSSNTEQKKITKKTRKALLTKEYYSQIKRFLLDNKDYLTHLSTELSKRGFLTKNDFDEIKDSHKIINQTLLSE